MAAAVVIYDASCGLCRGSVAWLASRAAPGRIEFLPCASPERRERFPWLDERDCLEAMQLVLADGRVMSGAAAVPEILRGLRRWRWLAPLFALPGAARLAGRLYRWVARHRHGLSRAAGSRDA
jgi:predicted DCC family thiol-disulfide oxidoreductase YuxK